MYVCGLLCDLCLQTSRLKASEKHVELLIITVYKPSQTWCLHPDILWVEYLNHYNLYDPLGVHYVWTKCCVDWYLAAQYWPYHLTVKDVFLWCKYNFSSNLCCSWSRLRTLIIFKLIPQSKLMSAILLSTCTYNVVNFPLFPHLYLSCPKTFWWLLFPKNYRLLSLLLYHPWSSLISFSCVPHNMSSFLYISHHLYISLQTKLLTPFQQRVIRIALEINAFKIAKFGFNLAGIKIQSPATEKLPLKGNLKKGKDGKSSKKVIHSSWLVLLSSLSLYLVSCSPFFKLLSF